MKIIYIPVTVPWNKRSMVAMFIALCCLLTVGFANLSTDWYRENYYITHIDQKEDLDTVNLRIGPWKMAMELCGWNKIFGHRVCHTKYSVFQECHRPSGQTPDLSRFSSHQETAWRGFDWCSGWKFVMAGLALMLLAVALQFVAIFISLVRERCHGPLALVCTLLALSGIVCFAEGVAKFMTHEIPKLENLMSNNGAIAVHNSRRPGTALVFAGIAIFFWAIAAVLSMSLFCSRGRGQPPNDQRSPEIMVVTTNRSELGGPMSAVPPTPSDLPAARSTHQTGIEEVDYGDDVEMRNQSHPSTMNRDRYEAS